MTDRSTPLSGSLGTYRLLDLLSVGGMAEVFRARTCGTNGFERIVAVKRILPQFAKDEHFMAMFIQEAKIAARLDHPNIVKTLDLGLSRGSYFLAMEYVPSLDLRGLLGWCNRAGVRLPIAHTCRIVADVCDALSYLHNQRDGDRSLELVHRDISPSNVLISSNGEVKLIDFGVAKTARARALTEDGTVKGKIPYLAPERLYGGGDHRADIFGAGVLLWELLCAERLFPGQDDREIVRRIKHGVTPPASSKNHLVPPALDAVLARALALDPADRYQDASEMHDELRTIARTSGDDYGERALVNWLEQHTVGELMPTDDPPTDVTLIDDHPRGQTRATTARGKGKGKHRAPSAKTPLGRQRKPKATATGSKPRGGVRQSTTLVDAPPTRVDRTEPDTGETVVETPSHRLPPLPDNAGARVTFRAPTNGDAAVRAPGSQRRVSTSAATMVRSRPPRPRTNEHVVRRVPRGTPASPIAAAPDAHPSPGDPNAVEVRVYSEPPGAEVTLQMPGESRHLGATPACAWLDRGSAYLLTVRHPGHEDWTTRLVFHDGSTCAVSALLRPSEPRAEFKDAGEPLPGTAYFYGRAR